MMSFSIRAYKITDKPNVLALIKLNTPTFFHPSEEKGFSNYLDNELEQYFVVEQHTKVIGCGGINFEADEKTAIISWDIIHSKYQGQGIGKALLKHRIVEIKKNDQTQTIKVRTSQHTHIFYKKSGFKLQKIVANYWEEGFDLYEMKIDLTV